LKNILIFVLTGFLIFLASGCKKDDSIFKNDPVDPGILRTDETGRILGGDYSDWCMHTAVDTFTHVIAFNVTTVSANTAKLQWITSKEYHSFGFDIERSLKTDTVFSKIGFLPGAGISSDSTAYLYYDSVISNVSNYKYRIKITDIFGNFSYEPHGIININPPLNYSFGPIYPNPVSSYFNIRFSISKKDTVSIFFLNNNDSIFVLHNDIKNIGTYEILCNNIFNYHNIQKRLYIKCHSLPVSDSCRSYGDIQFN
jgi:hypothetical protein